MSIAMRIERIIGEHGQQEKLCNGGHCPAAILTEDGHVFVQGYEPDQLGQLQAPAGENFVKMPRETFERIARHFLGG